MTMNTSLFAQILPMFTNQTERAGTEALRHILQRSEPARNALEHMVRAVGVEVDSLMQFRTEAIGDEGERVDLVCYDEHGTERLLIEAKFWAGLTDNQPNTYLARLPEDTHSALIFVVPAQRIETLWPELCRRAEEQHQLTINSDMPMSGEARSVSVGTNGHTMMMTSWRAVLEQMESRAGNAGDSGVVTDISQLRGLTERMDTDAFLPIHHNEFGQEIPRRMLNLVNLVDDATQRVIANGWGDASNLRATPQWYGYGRYFRLHDVVVWFGIDISSWAWAESGHTPLWLGPSDSSWWDPIYLPAGVEYPDVLDSVVDQINVIRHSLISEGGDQ